MSLGLPVAWYLPFSGDGFDVFLTLCYLESVFMTYFVLPILLLTI